MPVSEVYNMDCLEFMRTLPDGFFDLAIADPPYREDNSPTKEMKAKSRHENLFQASVFNEEMYNEIARVSKGQIIFGANNYWYPFKGFIAWDKQVRGSSMYSQVEIASLSESISKVSRFVSISCYNNDGKIHPTQKPAELYAWILRTYATNGGKIFDPMMGSQSSRIAAFKLGFDFWGCELDKEYFDLGCERFEKECNGITRLSDGTTMKQLSLFGE